MHSTDPKTKMEVKEISREVIKPSSPTPQHLRNFKLSVIDQLTPSVYGSLVFFYSFTSNGFLTSQKLKKSLSNTLTLFYPFAGTTIDNTIIDCNDNGALFVESKVDISMSNFLQNPNGHFLKQFVPTEVESTEQSTGFFTLVQVTFFSGGGFAIGVCISHKHADASTVGMFMKSWAEQTTAAKNNRFVPVYKSAALFPSRKFPVQIKPLLNIGKQKHPLKRLVFSSSKIVSLKAASATVGDDTPTRSEAVTAAIWKSALNAARSNTKSSRESILTRAVNIRGKISPPVTSNAVGNIVGFYVAKQDNTKVELRDLVREMRKGMKLFDEKYVKMLKTEEGLSGYFAEAASMMMRDDMEFYISLCNMELYETDFGSGRPVWVTAPCASNRNVMMLMDTNRGDGSVEAWVVLGEEDMCLFERDPDLLEFASFDRNVLEDACMVMKSSM